MDTAGEGEGEPNHDSTTEIYTLPCVKANGKLLYSAGSPAWGSVTTYRSGMGMGVGRKMGGRFKMEGTYVYLWLIHVEV